MMRRIYLLICLVAVAACDRAAEPSARVVDSPDTATQPTPHVDSIFPPEEQLRRFRAGVPEPSGLSGGAPSLEELVIRYVQALETRDTAHLRDMALSRSEFAYLYYPSSPFAQPPTQTDPALVWFLIQQNSEKGIVRALRRYGGKALGYVSYRCDLTPEPQGDNRIWNDCQVVVTFGGTEPATYRLFGSVVEHGGHFKFVSYANEL